MRYIMVNTPWTYPEQKRLAELYERFDMNGCAMILNRPYASIKYMVGQMGLKSLRNTGGNTRIFFADSVANIFELMTMGFSAEDIAKCFRVPVRTIQVTIKRAEREGFDAYPTR